MGKAIDDLIAIQYEKPQDCMYSYLYKKYFQD